MQPLTIFPVYISEGFQIQTREGGEGMSDDKIVELFWERSKDAITEMSAKYSNYCRAIAFNILQDNEDADECVNDTFLRAWNAIPPTRPNRLSTYLGKITRNLSFNRYEKQKASKRGGGIEEIALSELEECVPSSMNVEQTIDERILTETINRFLSELPEQQRIVFVRRYWYLYSIAEIANDFNITESKVKSILFRARKKLKIYLKKGEIMI